MKTITARAGQTIFDLAIQYLGGIDGIWDILDANQQLQLDLAIPAGTQVNIPDNMVNKRVAEYFTTNDLYPVSGMGDEAVITQDDMNNIKQDLDYDLSQGDKEFDRVQLFFLRDMLTVQISYSELSTGTVIFSIDQSTDGVGWSPVPNPNTGGNVSFVLDPTTDTHIFNIVGILTNFVRGHIQTPDATTGTINHIIFKT